jgi:hypothetical protein
MFTCYKTQLNDTQPCVRVRYCGNADKPPDVTEFLGKGDFPK